MKIGIVCPANSTNSGDLVILEGCRKLLQEAFGNYEEVLHDFDFGFTGKIFPLSDSFESIQATMDGAIEARKHIDKFIKSDIDLLVVAGTPWIWDMCQKSDKYKRLEYIVDGMPNVKKIALGLGASFPLATNAFSMYFDHPDKLRFATRSFKNIWGKFDFISCRDMLAYDCIKLTGIDCDLHYCPASFIDVPSDSLTHDKPVLVFHNPRCGTSTEALDERFVEDYIGFQLKFIDKHNPKIIAMCKSDLDWLVDHERTDWKKVEQQGMLITQPEQLYDRLRDASFVISSRVHAAIPAALMGKPTYIMPVDTRYLTATLVGVRPLLTWGSPDIDVGSFNCTLPIEDIQADKQSFIERIRGAV